MTMVNTDLIILGMIHLMPGHGYQLKKNIQESFGNPYFKMNNNVLYPTLARLEREGHIVGNRVSGDKIPDKKVYRITESGKRKLLELVATPLPPGSDDFEFKVHAVFFDQVSKDDRVRVILPLYEAKKAEYREALVKRETYGRHMMPVARTVLEYGIEEMENALRFYEKLMEMD